MWRLANDEFSMKKLISDQSPGSENIACFDLLPQALPMIVGIRLASVWSLYQHESSPNAHLVNFSLL
jgi:hypothetical protein